MEKTMDLIDFTGHYAQNHRLPKDFTRDKNNGFPRFFRGEE